MKNLENSPEKEKISKKTENEIKSTLRLLKMSDLLKLFEESSNNIKTKITQALNIDSSFKEFMEKCTKEDRQIFSNIAVDIKTSPDKYRTAGKWLDEYNHEEDYYRNKTERLKLLIELRNVNFCGRAKNKKDQAEEILWLWLSLACTAIGLKTLFEDFRCFLNGAKGRKKLETETKKTFNQSSLAKLKSGLFPNGVNSYVTKAEVLFKHLESKGIIEAEGTDEIINLCSLEEAIYNLREDPALNVFVDIENAYRISLITWLLTDPDTNKEPIGVTSLENLPWKNGRFMPSVYFFGAPDNTSWLKLIRTAWAKIETEKPAETGKKEIFEAKPGVAGFTVNIKELAKRIWMRVCSRKKG